MLVEVLQDSGKDFVNSARSVDNNEIEILGDFGIGSVDFLLKLVRLRFEGFGSFATVGLAS